MSRPRLAAFRPRSRTYPYPASQTYSLFPKLLSLCLPITTTVLTFNTRGNSAFFWILKKQYQTACILCVCVCVCLVTFIQRICEVPLISSTCGLVLFFAEVYTTANVYHRSSIFSWSTIFKIFIYWFERDMICCSTHSCTHWLIPVCAGSGITL